MTKFIEVLDSRDCESAIIACVDEPTIDKTDDYWYVSAPAFLKLSDCSRWINWELYTGYRGRSGGYNIQKIDKAISILIQIRDEMLKHDGKFLALTRECEAHNKASKDTTVRESESHE